MASKKGGYGVIACGWCGQDFNRKHPENRFCSRSCGAKHRQARLGPDGHPGARRVSDEVIKAAVEDINAGMTWVEAMSKHGVSQGTIEARVALRGWGLRRGQRPIIRRATLSLPESEGDIGYLAGIIDGEGNISLTRARPHLPWSGGRVFVFNTDEALISWLRAMGGYVASRTRIGTLGTKPCYAWGVTGRADVELLLRAIRPYMRVKGHLADQILALYESRPVETRSVSI